METQASRRLYERSLKFVLFCAIRRLWGNARVNERYSLGGGVLITIDMGRALNEQDLKAIKDECAKIIDADLPFVKKRLTLSEAVSLFENDGQLDKADLLKWRASDYFDVYTIDDCGYMDYFYGKMLSSTGCIKSFNIELYNGGLVVLKQSFENPNIPDVYVKTPKLAKTLAQSEQWGEYVKCDSVSKLNKHVMNGSIHELIRVNEALHERAYANMADEIARKRARAVMVAGPSSSGKTTSANRIATQLTAIGLEPIMLSLDNYYIDRDKIEPDERGELDLENINTLDTERFSHDLACLIRGESTEVPIYNFNTGKREKKGMQLTARAENPIIVEGIHGLNPAMLTSEVPENEVYRVYVSALTTLNLDDHNRIHTSDVRFLRRLVRDYSTRGASVEKTFSMWHSVRLGEQEWIFPYQEKADIIFNTSLVYELAILKRYAHELLSEVYESSRYYTIAQDIIKFLNCFADVSKSVEREIPPTSVLREFIGDNAFYS